MAYLQARAGIARAGVTYAGLVPAAISVWVGGVDYTALGYIEHETFEVGQAVNTPATCNFVVNGTTPVAGADVVVLRATPDKRLFGGTLMVPEVSFEGPASESVLWNCMADGYAWRLGRGASITKSYRQVAVNTIVADVLVTSALDSGSEGFRVGYVPSTLGYLDIDFVLANAYDALTQIASAVQAELRISPDRIVSLYHTSPSAPLATLEDDSEIWNVQYGEELSLARTVLELRCNKKQVTVTADTVIWSNVPTDVEVSDISEFDPNGGLLIAGTARLLYTGTSRPAFPTAPGNLSGPGTLNGVQGSAVMVELRANDAIDFIKNAFGDAASMSTRLGGLNGFVIRPLDNMSLAEVSVRSAQEFSQYGQPPKRLKYETADMATEAGRVLSAAITSPAAVSGDFKIQSVTIRMVGGLDGDTVRLERTVVCAPILIERKFTQVFGNLTKGQ